MNKQIEEYSTAFREIRESGVGFLENLRDDQLNWRPDPNRWSVGECFDHMNITGGLLLPGIEEAIASGWERGVASEGPFSYGWPGRMFIESMQPGSRFKMKTMRVYTPALTHDGKILAIRFSDLQEGFLRALRDSDGLDLGRLRVASPANRLVRFCLGVWYEVTIAHQRRHLAQAAALRQAEGFPG
jgi:hypothetical protein